MRLNVLIDEVAEVEKIVDREQLVKELEEKLEDSDSRQSTVISELSSSAHLPFWARICQASGCTFTRGLSRSGATQTGADARFILVYPGPESM
ncbi:hypothetical protein VKT23_016586 [Stygiomarasmius scandens]|uniref:Uncharacterized protein n=1 Tax=Marasmiellus scandens TaxID=2682957 RepID=A0ABR1IVX9_9AGAR